jgi:hypothetical protein
MGPTFKWVPLLYMQTMSHVDDFCQVQKDSCHEDNHAIHSYYNDQHDYYTKNSI